MFCKVEIAIKNGVRDLCLKKTYPQKYEHFQEFLDRAPYGDLGQRT